MARTPAILLACLALFAGAFATPLISPPERGELVRLNRAHIGMWTAAGSCCQPATHTTAWRQTFAIAAQPAFVFLTSMLPTAAPYTLCPLQGMLMAAHALADTSSASSIPATAAAAAPTATCARPTVSANRLHAVTAGSVMSAALLNCVPPLTAAPAADCS